MTACGCHGAGCSQGGLEDLGAASQLQPGRAARQPQASTAMADLSSDVILARLETVWLTFTPGRRGTVRSSWGREWCPRPSSAR